MKRILWAGVLPALLILAAPATAAGVNVFVSIPPQKYFAWKICGDAARVFVMVPPGADPHTYEPKPRQMTELARAAAYFAIGIGFERAWLGRIRAANQNMVVVPTQEGIEKIPMASHHHGQEDEKHQGQEEGGHGTLDPHVWTSPLRVKIIARNILKGMKRVDPKNGARYEANYRSFIKELDVLDARLKEVFKNGQGSRFMVFHPAWGYLARDYGLVQTPVEIEGKAPKPAQLRALIDQAKKLGIKVIFVQPQMSSRSARLIAREIGGQVIVADPLAEDWSGNLEAQAQAFSRALK